MVIIAAGGGEKGMMFIDIAGGLGAGMIAFALPSVIYFRVFGFKKIKNQTCEILASREKGCWSKFCAIVDLVLPIIVCVLGTLCSLFAVVVAVAKAADPNFGLDFDTNIKPGH